VDLDLDLDANVNAVVVAVVFLDAAGGRVLPKTMHVRLEAMAVFGQAELSQARELLERIVSILTGLIRP